jgi:hypothetical protein
VIAAVPERMPVILDPDAYDLWLDLNGVFQFIDFDFLFDGTGDINSGNVGKTESEAKYIRKFLFNGLFEISV